MRWTNVRARRLGRVVVLAVVGLHVTLPVVVAVVLAAPGPAGAHAVVRGTDPEDGARLALAPGRVTVFFAAKLPTVEGDPLQVYDPKGVRIDAGDARVDEGGPDGPAALSVSVRRDLPHPDGDYQVVYRVISADTHLVTGRFAFRCDGDGDRDGDGDAVPGDGSDGSVLAAVHAPGPVPPPLAQGWPADRWHWPKTAFLAGLAMAALGALVRRLRGAGHRGAAPVAVPWTVGMPGLVAGRRLD